MIQSQYNCFVSQIHLILKMKKRSWLFQFDPKPLSILEMFQSFPYDFQYDSDFFSKCCSFVIVKIIATSKNLLKFESSLLILMNEFIFSPTNIDIGVLKVKEIDFCEEVHNFRVSLIM